MEDGAFEDEPGVGWVDEAESEEPVEEPIIDELRYDGMS